MSNNPTPSGPAAAVGSDAGAASAPSRVAAPLAAPAPAPAPTPTRKRRWWPTLLAIWLLSLVGVWGYMASRAASLIYAHQQLQLSYDWTDARMQVLDAQAQLTGNNYGRAAEALRAAVPRIASVRARLRELGFDNVGRQLAEAESQLSIGASLVERQDSAASTQAIAVVRALDVARTAAAGAFVSAPVVPR